VTRIVILFDVDNTLVDNDRVKADMEARIESLVADRAAAFWSSYEAVRQERGYVDVPRTIERFGRAFPGEPNFPRVAAELMCFPFERYLYAGALDAVAHARRLGTAAILSDGDLVFQPAKIARSGLADAVGGNVMVFTHKQEHLDEVMQRYPADRYVLVDDKPGILAAVKRQLGSRLVTVHVEQGHYAQEGEHRDLPAPDHELPAIGQFAAFSAATFVSVR